MQSLNDENKNKLMEYRITKVEEAVARLSVLSEVIVRWDSKFASSDLFINLPVYVNRLDNCEKKIEKFATDMDEMKKFLYKITGAFIVISIIFQLVGPILVEKLRDTPSQPPILKVEER